MKQNWHLGLIFGLLTTLFSCQAVVVSQLTTWLQPDEQERICEMTPALDGNTNNAERWRPLAEANRVFISPQLAPKAVQPCPLKSLPKPVAAPVADPTPPCPAAVTSTVKLLSAAPVPLSSWG